MKKKNIYCVYCGEKNEINNLKCKKCNKKLNPKENMLLDYIKDHLKGDVEDKLIDIIKNIIIHHLYGTFLTATLIFTIVSGVITNIPNDNIIEVQNKPTILIDNLNKCVIANSKELTNVCKDGYILKDDICTKEEINEVKENYICPNGYYPGGNVCISNENIAMLTRQECIAPADDNVVGTTVENGVCLVNYCSGWTDGECSAGSMEPIDFTTISYCPTGTTLINGVCKLTTNYNVTYTCEQGDLVENKCIINKQEQPELGCEEGYNLNEECNLCVLGE